MECKRVAKLPEGEDWSYEVKQDGYRAIAVVDGSLAMLYSMSGKDFTSEFAHIVFALKNLGPGDMVLDGEIVALDAEVRASFQELQNRRRTRASRVYYAFDVLDWKHQDTLDVPLFERKKILEDVATHFNGSLRLNRDSRLN